jgi:hypothetical protein
MQKKFTALLLVAVLSIPLCFISCNTQEGFAIYLTRDDIPVSQMEALSHVEIADKPVISSKDIISYNKDTHEIELTADAYQRIIELEVPMSGLSFIVCVGKGPIYWGAFWAPISSQSFDGVTIVVRPVFPVEVPHFSFQLELGYPSESFYQGEDPRSNPEILESLEEAGKLK